MNSEEAITKYLKANNRKGNSSFYLTKYGESNAVVTYKTTPSIYLPKTKNIALQVVFLCCIVCCCFLLIGLVYFVILQLNSYYKEDITLRLNVNDSV